MSQNIVSNGVTFVLSGNRTTEFANYVNQLSSTSDWAQQSEIVRGAGISNIVITSDPNDLPSSIRGTAYNDVYNLRDPSSGQNIEVSGITLDSPGKSSTAYILMNNVAGVDENGATRDLAAVVHEIYHVGYTSTASHPDWWAESVNDQLDEINPSYAGQARSPYLTFNHSTTPIPTLDANAPQTPGIGVNHDDPTLDGLESVLPLPDIDELDSYDDNGNFSIKAYDIQDDDITLSLDTDPSSVYGNNDIIDLVDNSNSTANISGSGNTINSNGNTVYLDGDGSQMVEYGSNTTIINGNNQALNINTNGGLIETAYVNGADYSGATISANYATVDTGSTSTVYASYSTVNLATSDADSTINGWQTTVNANLDRVTLAGQGNVFTVDGYNNGVNIVNDEETLYVNGGDAIYLADNLSGVVIDASYSTVYEGYNDNVTIDGSGDSFDGDYTDETDYNGEWYDDGGDDDGGEPYDPEDPWDGYDGYSFARPLTSTSGTQLDVIAQFDQAIGDQKAVARAEKARSQAEAALNATGSKDTDTTAVYDGPKWAPTTDTATGAKVITWSFASSAGMTADPFSGFLNGEYKATAEKAMQAWASASGLTLKEVPDSSSVDIRIGWGDFDTKDSGVLGYTSFGVQKATIQPGAIIRLEDPSETALSPGGPEQQTYAGTQATLYQVLLHEIGHALGLADNADPSSVMYAVASSNNRTLDQTDSAGIGFLYQTSPATASASGTGASASSSASSGASADGGLNQLVQAMASFGAQPASSTVLPPQGQSFALAQQLAAPLH